MSDDIVDVIIPVYNQYEVVRDCIGSVLRALPLNRMAVTIIDDASTDPDLGVFLREVAAGGRVSLYTNPVNLGFTGTVNLGMRMHPERDVLLLNSDTVVYGTWLERLRAAAYSEPRVATANPLTSASHISAYPDRQSANEGALEVADDEIDALASQWNAGQRVAVHTTVGFCMYIRRAAIRAVGTFDERHFPIGYGEESDFCYRARKTGWSHVVTGDTYVRHREGQSFGERKQRLVESMIGRFVALHPELPALDRRFRERDPLLPLRARLDLARLARLVAGRIITVIVRGDAPEACEGAPCHLLFDPQQGTLRFVIPADARLPNLPAYRVPADLLRLNRHLKALCIAGLSFAEAAGGRALIEAVRHRREEIRLDVPVYWSELLGVDRSGIGN